MRFLIFLFAILVLSSCDDNTSLLPDDEPQLIFKFKFDENQERLDGFGNPSSMPQGNAAQNPSFNSISAHYIELAKDSLTLLGTGEVLYKSPETTAGGAQAIDFDKAFVVKEGETFFSIPLSYVTNGSYNWLRVSLSYQNFDILLDAEVNGQTFTDIRATAASFIGYNTYITTYDVKNQPVTVNGNKLQGYVGIETQFSLNEFQAPPGATTVPNPLFNTSPIEPGSCVVTGAFSSPLTITSNAEEDIVVEMSLSINNSFEWKDDNSNGRFEPLAGEQVVDMGIRGLIPSFN